MAAAGFGADGVHGESAALVEVLGAARERGLLGPGGVETHVAHALGFGEAAGGRPHGVALDLGSGGGIPGLVLALEWPDSEWLLLDGRVRSTRFLTEAVGRLGLEKRVRVIEARAEVAGHDPALRGSVHLVVARGLGSPAVTAECGAGFLRPGGRLVVSEPPGSIGSRWSPSALAKLGLSPAAVVEGAGGYGYAVLEQVAVCPARYPRRVGIPAKRPLFGGST
jgi:16S rRNA (guanine527-N7)-methyltransferase